MDEWHVPIKVNKKQTAECISCLENWEESEMAKCIGELMEYRI